MLLSARAGVRSLEGLQQPAARWLEATSAACVSTADSLQGASGSGRSSAGSGLRSFSSSPQLDDYGQRHMGQQPGGWQRRRPARGGGGAPGAQEAGGPTGPGGGGQGQGRQRPKFPAYVYNVSQSLTREDIAAFFDGYGLPPEEIRPEYSWRDFAVERFWLNFGTEVERERAMSRHMAYLGTRRALLRRAQPHDFSASIFNPLAMSSRGCYVLVDSLSSANTSEDVIRFFQGFDLHPKSVTFLRDQEASQNRSRAKLAELVTEKAVVRFTSPLEAHRAVRSKQGGFCGNNRVRLRLLQ